MKKYKFNPEEYKFNSSEKYSEFGDFFGTPAHIKVIATDENTGNCWYVAILNQLTNDKYTIYIGTFTKNRTIEKDEFPKVIYKGLISGQAFAQELLKNLMGTMENESVQTIGKERLNAKCLYLFK